MKKNCEFLIGYHSNSNFECNTERGSIESLSIALGAQEENSTMLVIISGTRQSFSTTQLCKFLVRLLKYKCKILMNIIKDDTEMETAREAEPAGNIESIE